MATSRVAPCPVVFPVPVAPDQSTAGFSPRPVAPGGVFSGYGATVGLEAHNLAIAGFNSQARDKASTARVRLAVAG